MTNETRQLLEILGRENPDDRLGQLLPQEELTLEERTMHVIGFYRGGRSDDYAKTADTYLVLSQEPLEFNGFNRGRDRVDFVVVLDRQQTPWRWTLLKFQGNSLVSTGRGFNYTPIL